MSAASAAARRFPPLLSARSAASASFPSSNVYRSSASDPDIFNIGPNPRRLFKPYQNYKPEDLDQRNAVYFEKSLKNQPKIDVFAVLKINPLDMYKA
ncbi:hypothetical protein HDU83_008473 [Entophlyctis luteolus]|nr:hypothetical protein HDU82_002822 [Entophlyctis luteolus]KAJ3351950.1 hypothetical protein HDU83_008473 [Entophlyctis luteolus]KAJ3390123.1 hypothetical protein HDU84_007948 [Entophlyctis sp. JEL0112]